MQVYLNFGVFYEGFDLQNTPELQRKQFNDTLEAIEVMITNKLIKLKNKDNTVSNDIKVNSVK